MSTVRVSRAMAHMSPMNHPWLEMPPWILARPVRDKTFTYQPIFDTYWGHFIECWHPLRTSDTKWETPGKLQDGNVLILILNCQTACLINQWKRLIKHNCFYQVHRTHALGWTWHTPRMIILSQDVACTINEMRKKETKTILVCISVISETVFSSPLTLVLITSSKILELSTQLLVIRRTVYSVPGSSPSMMWKVLEEFSASDIFQLPSPTRCA